MPHTKGAIIHDVSAKTRVPTGRAEAVVNCVFDSMVAALVRGEGIEIRRFGSFTVREYGAYDGRNPRTGERTRVERKRLPRLKVSQELRERVSAGHPLTRVRALSGRVAVEAVPHALFEAAQRIASPPLRGIGPGVCESNSYRLAVAISSQDGIDEVCLVGGLSFPFGVGFEGRPDTPRAHVWVRTGSKHLDITWPLTGPIAQAEYYPLRELPLSKTKGWESLGLLRSIWNIAENNNISYL